MSYPNLFLLGTGQVGKTVIEQAQGSRRIVASTRDPRRIFEMAELGVEPLIMPLPSAEIVGSIAPGSDVLISFPPDGSTDAIFAPACASARRIVYISSTGVYGTKSGKIDDASTPDSSDERIRPRLQAEAIWKEHGAIVLRVPGIYGPKSGLHLRLAQGNFKLPADGANFISRIHLVDLAKVILAVFDARDLSDSTYLIGDEHPCTIAEVVNWLCNEMKLALPESIPLSQASPTLKGNRAVDASRLIKELGLSLDFPSYKEGYKQCLKVHEQIS